LVDVFQVNIKLGFQWLYRSRGFLLDSCFLMLLLLILMLNYTFKYFVMYFLLRGFDF
jgi:hypothetical protein